MTETDSSTRSKEGLPPPSEPGDPAYITDEDIERAKRAWREDAPHEMRHLLDAEAVD